MSKLTTDEILETLKVLVESRKIIPRDEWLRIAFQLNLLEIDEKKLFNQMRQAVAKKKLEIYSKQEKRSVAACDLEVEASDEFKFMRDQEAKIEAISQFVMISKKSSDY